VVSGGSEVEGHDLGAAVRDELLAGRTECRGHDTDRDAGDGDAGSEQHERDADRPSSPRR